MTLAFTFPIKDAWVIVSDKKMISKIKQNIEDGPGEINFFSDNVNKIKELPHNLIFVGSGEQEILEKIIEIINNSENFDEFKQNIKLKIDELYSLFGDTIHNEEFLIIEKDKQNAFKFEIQEIKKEKKEGVHELGLTKLENNFIGCYENCINFGNVKLKISSLKNKLFNNTNKEFNDNCNDQLSLLAIDNLNSVGHPAIHGSDIWIVSKNKVKKISTYPKNNYTYGVKRK